MAQSHDEVKFLHFRVFNGEAIDPRGGITIAYSPNEDGTFSVAEAVCSLKDNFERSKGRAIARARLRTDHQFAGTSVPMDELTFVTLSQLSMQEFGLVRKFSRNRKRR